MIQWTGASGPPLGMPHLSFVPRKPVPLGCELKCVADGTSGVMMDLELQEGKTRMMRARFADEYPVTVATTLRMVAAMGLIRGEKSTCWRQITSRRNRGFMVRVTPNSLHVAGKIRCRVHGLRQNSTCRFPHRGNALDLGESRKRSVMRVQVRKRGRVGCRLERCALQDLHYDAWLHE
jgi:hypothetical protein